MKVVLAIDVGIRNLAACCLSEKDGILFWELLNTLGGDGLDAPTCQERLKSGKPCRCRAKYVVRAAATAPESPEYFCAKHNKAHQGGSALKPPPKVKGLTMQTIAEKVLQALADLQERHAEVFSTLDRCVIELQPRVNNKMKFTSHVIFGKLTDSFLVEGKKASVRFVGAKRKLLAHGKQEKNTYAKRKKLAVALAREWVAEREEGWLPFFDACRKKDDLSDSLLMAIDEVSR